MHAYTPEGCTHVVHVVCGNAARADSVAKVVAKSELQNQLS